MWTFVENQVQKVLKTNLLTLHLNRGGHVSGTAHSCRGSSIGKTASTIGLLTAREQSFWAAFSDSGSKHAESSVSHLGTSKGD